MTVSFQKTVFNPWLLVAACATRQGEFTLTANFDKLAYQ
jgi:hypothetical protein